MENKDYIAELFKSKFENFEAPVSPEMWSAVSSSIASTTITKVGMSLLSKSLIGFSAAAVIGVTSYLVVSNDTKKEVISKSERISSNEKNTENDVISQQSTLNSEINKKEPNAIVYHSGSFSNDLPILISDDRIIDTEQEIIVPPLMELEPSAISESTATLYTKETATSSNTANEENTLTHNEETTVKEIAQIWKKLPNTFSPNADGVNDLFFIEDNNVSDFSITIIDSKNNIVYKSDEVNFKWDGRDFSGNLVEAGTYIYYVMGSDHSNKKIAKTSYLTIIR